MCDVRSPAGSPAPWPIPPSWRSSLHTRYLQAEPRRRVQGTERQRRCNVCLISTPKYAPKIIKTRQTLQLYSWRAQYKHHVFVIFTSPTRIDTLLHPGQQLFGVLGPGLGVEQRRLHPAVLPLQRAVHLLGPRRRRRPWGAGGSNICDSDGKARADLG